MGTVVEGMGEGTGGSSPSYSEGPSLLFRVRGEAQRGWSFGGSQAPSHQLGGLEEVPSAESGAEPRPLKGSLAL